MVLRLCAAAFGTLFVFACLAWIALVEVPARAVRTISHLSILCALILSGCSTAQYSDVSELNKNPQAGVRISTNRTVESGLELNKNPAMPPSPLAAKIQEAAESSRLEMAVSPVKSNAAIALRWEGVSLRGAEQIWIYGTNGIKVMTVASNFNNCTIRGLRDGDAYAFYAIAVNKDYDGEQSNIAIGTASVKPLWIVPASLPYARTFSWKCAPGVTNILQSSPNLTTWATASRFRGTNGTAVVTLTNQLPFHRVLVQNATNIAPMTLTQAVSFITLSWLGDGKPKLLERLADERTESYLPVLTNSGNGIVSVIQPFSGAKYRVVQQ